MSGGCKEIERGLFIGNLGSAQRVLRENGGQHNISHVLSVRAQPCLPDLIKKTTVNYKFTKWFDMEEEEIINDRRLIDAVHFVKTVIDNEQSVLVHCDAGISRSGTVLVAYLMQKHKETPAAAMKRCERSGYWVHPNSGFLAQLEIYHLMLLDKDKGESSKLLIPSKDALTLDNKEKPVAHITDSSGCSNESEPLDNGTDGSVASSNGVMVESAIATAPRVFSFYRCSTCRCALFTDDNVACHVRRPNTRAHNDGDKALSVTDTDTSIYCSHKYLLTEPMAWMRQQVITEDKDQTGKLLCPGKEGRCGAKLGQFNWCGRECACQSQVRPWFFVAAARVDVCKMEDDQKEHFRDVLPTCYEEDEKQNSEVIDA